MGNVLRFPAAEYEPLVTRKVIADHFKVSTKTVARWEAEGLLGPSIGRSATGFPK
jgi:hypothetical protein